MPRIAFALLILASAARSTTAEINAADTIEWITADADAAYIGKVSQIGKSGEDYDVTLAVTETLKGATAKSITFAMHHYAGETPDAYKARGAELLVFVVASKRYVKDDKNLARQPLAVRMTHGDPAIYDLAKPRAFTTAFGVIDKRAALLAAVRAAAASKATKAHQVDVPWNTDAQKALYSGSSVWLYFPVDSSLELVAKSWLGSTDVQLRDEGVRALAYFQSPDNVKRLVALLADPGFIGTSDAKGKSIKRYIVRKRAHELLAQWGVAHAAPVIDTP